MSATDRCNPSESRRGRALVTFAALLLLLFTACSRPPVWPPVAAEPDLGHDSCGHCRMIVSDVRFAAQCHERDGVVAFFDDLGCLLAARGGARCDPQAIFVRAFDDAGWIRGDAGFVVRADAFTSPMGFGAATFATRPAADAAARAHAGATVIELATLLRQGIRATGSAVADAFVGPEGDHP